MIKVIFYFLVSTPALLVLSLFYSYCLLALAKYTHGKSKMILSMFIYIPFSFAFISPLLYLLWQSGISSHSSWLALLQVIFYYVLSLTPAFIFLFKYKINALKQAGYFK